MNGSELYNEWISVCRIIVSYPNVNPSQFNAFVARLKPQAMSSGYIMLTADNGFIKSWIEKHYIQYIKDALAEKYGVDFEVDIEVDPTQAIPDGGAPITADRLLSREEPQAETKIAIQPEVAKEEPQPIQMSTPQQKRALGGASSYTFQNFVIGDSNNMAYSMAVAVAEDPGKPMLNPLFIYGKSGLGKTHLLRAIQNYIAETRPDLRTVYVDSAEYLNGYIVSEYRIVYISNRFNYHL